MSVARAVAFNHGGMVHFSHFTRLNLTGVSEPLGLGYGGVLSMGRSSELKAPNLVAFPIKYHPMSSTCRDLRWSSGHDFRLSPDQEQARETGVRVSDNLL